MIEDEKFLAKAVAEILKKNKYSIDLAHDGEYGLDLALTGIYDLFIIDITLPKMDGFTILENIRKQGIDTPVILLTARGDVSDRVRGLDLGADDYLPKPFHNDELLARLRALSRRKSEIQVEGLLTFSDLKLSPNTLTLSCGERAVKMALKESQILEMLINNKNRAISKQQIIEKVWGYDSEAEENHVEVHISLIRKKIKKVKSKASIKIIRGVGYILKGD